VIINAFHGTAVRFDAFDTSRGGEVTGYHGADRGVFFAACEADCWSYAEKAARRLAEWSDEGDAGGVVMACTITARNPLVVDVDGLEGVDMDDDVALLDYADDQGHDVVVLLHGNANNCGETFIVLNRHADLIKILAAWVL
jgi:hypothetical protein